MARRPATIDQLIANRRGLALAVFAPIDVLTALLGGDETAALELRTQAVNDWHRLKAQVAATRRGLG